MNIDYSAHKILNSSCFLQLFMLEAALRRIQGSIDPALSTVEIAGRTSSRPEEMVTVSCFPSVQKAFPVLSIGELFSPELAAKKEGYVIQGEAKALYTAEGFLYFPALSDNSGCKERAFKIDMDYNNVYYLEIRCGDHTFFHGIDSQATVYNFLKALAENSVLVAAFGERQRNELARRIARGIETHFFGVGYDHPYRKRIRSLSQQGEQKALESYTPLLEEQLKDNPFQPLLPAIFKYKVITGSGGDRLEAIL